MRKKIKQLSGLSLRTKLTAGFVVISVIMAVIGVVGQTFLSELIGQLDSMVETTIIGNTITADLKTVVNTTDKFLTDRKDEQRNEITSAIERIESNLEELKRWTTDPESLAELESIKGTTEKIEKNINTILNIKDDESSGNYASLASENSRAEFFVETYISNFISNELKIQEAKREEIAKTTETTKTVLVVLYIFISAAAALLSSIYIGKVTGTIRRIAQSARLIANGDLTVQPVTVKSNDDLKILATAFNDMHNDLRQMMERIRQTAGNVAASAEALKNVSEQNAKAIEQIAESVQQVAAGSTEQSGRVGESGEVVKVLAEQISIMAASTQTALASSQLANDAAKAGYEKVSNLISQIDDIRDKLVMTNASASELKSKTSKIGSITETISTIAEQTNLLSLNAAIEAARAGDHGTGFAVVAEEIRKLAAASRKATDEIAKMLNEISQQSDNVSELMEHGLDAVNYSTDTARESGEAFNAIVSTSMDSADSISSVAEGIRSIESQIAKVQDLSREIDKISKSTMAGTTEIAAVIEEQTANQQEVLSSASMLSELSAELKDMTDTFKTE